ncbi:hypothetical protein GIB67_008279 [Kingdonia uniflora]|uniref:Uncharacterized protein n=1 Tax=Kingdonia uniflora TaxID=39325 RepID=A0A7J7N564_9MAGN|nr:hypothetical protein GIB67_008279 [Kingdonia uniflora]
MGWFLVIDSNELVTLTNEIGQSFSSIGSFKTQPRNVVPVVSEIMSRFYPRMRIVQILATLEVMPGYGAYVGDFSVAKDTLSSLQEKIQLFVAQLDNTETSSCIISPSLVKYIYLCLLAFMSYYSISFSLEIHIKRLCLSDFCSILLNGRGVERRTNVSMVRKK